MHRPEAIGHNRTRSTHQHTTRGPRRAAPSVCCCARQSRSVPPSPQRGEATRGPLSALDQPALAEARGAYHARPEQLGVQNQLGGLEVHHHLLQREDRLQRKAELHRVVGIPLHPPSAPECTPPRRIDESQPMSGPETSV